MSSPTDSRSLSGMGGKSGIFQIPDRIFQAANQNIFAESRQICGANLWRGYAFLRPLSKIVPIPFAAGTPAKTPTKPHPRITPISATLVHLISLAPAPLVDRIMHTI